MGLFENLLLGRKRVTESFFVNSYGNDQTRGIYTFRIDIDTGELLFKKHFKTPTNPTYSFDYGRFVCIAYKNRTGASSDGGLCTYASTADILALVSRLSDNGKTYMHAITDADDDNASRVLAVDYYHGEIMVGLIKKKKLIRPLSVYTLEGHSVDPVRQAMPHPHYIGFTPDRKKIYVVDLGLDKVLLFDLQEDGNLVLDEEHSFDVEPGSGPRKMIFSNDGKYAYITNEISNTIMVYAYNQEDYSFTLIQTVDTYDKETYPNETSIAGQFIFTEDGEYAIVTNRGHDSISSFRVDKETGMLTYVDFVDTSPNPRDICIFKDRFIVIACQKGGIMEVVELSKAKKGLLFEVDSTYLVNEPVCITRFRDITNQK